MEFPLPDKSYTVLVVVPTYNQANFIEQTLMGIVEQQVDFSFIVWVLDDNSSDGTKDILKRYENQYPDIIKVYYFNDNQHAKGMKTFFCLAPWLEKVKYFSICEGDDYWIDPYKLQKQVSFMETHSNYSMCFHNAMIHWEDEEKEDTLFAKIENRDYTGLEIFKNWTIPTASCLFRTDVLKDEKNLCNLKNNNIVYQDIVLFLLCAICGQIRGMDDTMSVYRRYKESLTTGYWQSMKDSYEINYKFCKHYLSLIEMFSDKLGSEFVEKCIEFYFPFNYNCMKLSLSSGNVGNLAKTIKEALRLSPKKMITYYCSRLFHRIQMIYA